MTTSFEEEFVRKYYVYITLNLLFEMCQVHKFSHIQIHFGN